MVAPAVIKAVPALQQDLIDHATYGYSNRTLGFLFGKRTATVQNVRVDVWEGPTAAYIFPPTPVQMSVVSTSASDTSNGTGARQIIIQYLDNNYAEQSEIVTLNGVTPVATVATNILRINETYVISAGSGGATAGNISITNGGVTYDFIGAGENFTRTGIFTIPAGKYGYLSHWQCSTGASSGAHFTQVTLRATAHRGVLYPGVFLAVDEMGSLNNGMTASFPTPIRFPPQTDFKITAISDAANANVSVMAVAIGWLEW